MSDRTVRVFCSDKCAFEGATLLEIEDLVQQIIANGGQIPDEYVPKTAVNEIIEQNKGKALKIWVGTQAEYDAYAGDKTNLFSIISDDPTLQSIKDTFEAQSARIESIENGFTPVSVKKSDGTMAQITQDENGVLKCGDIIIPHKRVLWEGDLTIDGSNTNNPDNIITLIESVKEGDILEFHWSVSGYNIISKGKTWHFSYKTENALDIVLPPAITRVGSDYDRGVSLQVKIELSLNQIRFGANGVGLFVEDSDYGVVNFSMGMFSEIKVFKVYKVIE